MVSICGPDRLLRCLRALALQDDAPAFEVVVARPCDASSAEIRGVDGLRIVDVRDGSTPPDLTAAGIRASAGSTVLLTEDHCVPGAGWIRRLAATAARADVGAAGGPVATGPRPSAFDWAFHVTDFASHVPPTPPGPSPSLSVCNVAYRREALDRIADVWSGGFHETRVHDVVRRDVGPLVRVPDAIVVSDRRARLVGALRERYAFGRLYGALRFGDAAGPARSLRGLALAALPLLSLTRFARATARAAIPAPTAALAVPAAIPLILAWTCGEALGTVTGRPPRHATPAPEPVPDRADAG